MTKLLKAAYTLMTLCLISIWFLPTKAAALVDVIGILLALLVIYLRCTEPNEVG